MTNDKKTIYILGHNYTYTDVDSIISSIVLADMIKRQGYLAEPVIINPDAISQNNREIINCIGGLNLPKLKAVEEVINNPIILVDHNNPLYSYGFFLTETEPEKPVFKLAAPILCVDHHYDEGFPANNKIIDIVGSTCTLLAEMTMVDEKFELSDLNAKALVYGIVSDTKGLKSSAVCERDMNAIYYLYNNYEINVELNKVIDQVLGVTDDVSKMNVDQILKNSLKEYCNGNIGIAVIEVSNDDYTEKIKEIKERAVYTKYPLYILMILKHHTDETLIYYFDKKGIFPDEERISGLLSRSQDVLPHVLIRMFYENYLNQN